MSTILLLTISDHWWSWVLLPVLTGALGWLLGQLFKKENPYKPTLMALSQRPPLGPVADEEPDEDEDEDKEIQYKVWAMVEMYDPVTQTYTELDSQSESAAVVTDESEAHDLVERMTRFGQMSKQDQQWMLSLFEARQHE